MSLKRVTLLSSILFLQLAACSSATDDRNPSRNTHENADQNPLDQSDQDQDQTQNPGESQNQNQNQNQDQDLDQAGAPGQPGDQDGSDQTDPNQPVQTQQDTANQPDANQTDPSQQAQSPDDEGPLPPTDPLDGNQVERWKTKLEKPPEWVADSSGQYTITVKKAMTQILPATFHKTQVFAFEGNAKSEGQEAKDQTVSPGATFEMTRGTPAKVKWINGIGTTHLFTPSSGAQSPSPVPMVLHVHGLEVASEFDGAPKSSFTGSVTYDYPNNQPATALWYHDHTFGITRLNVYAGMAGMYIIRDKTELANLPDRKHEWPLVIQDRSFDKNGNLIYQGGFGDVNVVNGKAWPEMTVEHAVYRFRVLNGSNNRFYQLALTDNNLASVTSPGITAIGSDGGYLKAPVPVSVLSLAPGERSDILIDFSKVSPGSYVVLNDQLGSPVVRFAVPATPVEGPVTGLPTLSNIAALPETTLKRTMTLNSASNYSLNGQTFDGLISEQPKLGTTEEWDLVNLSGEPHPIHVHLVQFQILQRFGLDTARYNTAWLDLNKDGGATLPFPTTYKTKELAVADYLTDIPGFPKAGTAPAPEEGGWKDTVSVPTDTVTRIRIRWTPQETTDWSTDGKYFKFDPTSGPGYVWHCHMLEHEDDEMMRPLRPLLGTPQQ